MKFSNRITTIIIIIIIIIIMQKLSFRRFVEVLKFTPDATFKFNIKKSDREKLANESAGLFSTLLLGLIDFEETLNLTYIS